LGGIQVLGLALVDHPAAETDHRAALVEDGEHDAVAKAVVAPALFLVDHQAGFGQALVAVVRKHFFQRLPVVRRIADSEARRGLTGTVAARPSTARGRTSPPAP